MMKLRIRGDGDGDAGGGGEGTGDSEGGKWLCACELPRAVCGACGPGYMQVPQASPGGAETGAEGEAGFEEELGHGMH